MERLGQLRTVVPLLASPVSLRGLGELYFFLSPKGSQMRKGGAGKDSHMSNGTGRGRRFRIYLSAVTL